MEDQRSELKRRFAASLLALRLAKGIRSQGELGQLVGVSEATVQRWEAPNKPHLPDLWELRELARALEVDLGELADPEELTDRERALLRKAARSVGPRTVDPGPVDPRPVTRLPVHDPVTDAKLEELEARGREPEPGARR